MRLANAPHIDDCQTATDVINKVSQSNAFRRAIFAPKLSSIIEPMPPARATPNITAEAVRAVAEAVKITDRDLLFGVEQEHVSARKLAIALCIRCALLPKTRVAKEFGVNVSVTHRPVFLLDRFLFKFAISRKTPIGDMAKMCWPTFKQECSIVRCDRPTLAEINQTVADVYGLQLSDLESARRILNLIIPRHLAFALGERLTLHSLPEIGRAMGGRDHTTALHGIRKMAPLIVELNKKYLETTPVEEWAMAAKFEIDNGFKLAATTR